MESVSIINCYEKSNSKKLKLNNNWIAASNENEKKSSIEMFNSIEII